jgi:hypothetical protein
VELSPGEKRLFFASTISPDTKSYRYEGDLFLWKATDSEGGAVARHGTSRLYYAYTAPKKPGTYQLRVELKDNPSTYSIVAVHVTGAAIAAGDRRVNGAALPQ